MTTEATENPTTTEVTSTESVSGVRSFVRRPVMLLTTIALIGLAVLGVVTLGTLASTDTATVSASRVSSVGGNGATLPGESADKTGNA